MLSNIIQNIFEQNRLGLPLFLTPKGIKASHDLINMLNLLPVDNSSKFKGDNFLFDYLSKASNLVFRYNMELTLKIINPINVFELPLGSQKVVDGDCSGLYCFKHKNIDKYGIGSALSCRSPKGVNKKLNLTQRRYYSTKKEENNYIPENIYENADIDKMQILDDNKNKAGVYL